MTTRNVPPQKNRLTARKSSTDADQINVDQLILTDQFGVLRGRVATYYLGKRKGRDV